MNIRHTFAKSERLCSQKVISELFEKGSSGFVFPFRYIYQLQPLEQGELSARVLVSVSKRYHKRANKRNLNKRRIREAYRLNNHELKQTLEGCDKSLKLALVYCSKQSEDYKTVEDAVKKIFSNIIAQVN